MVDGSLNEPLVIDGLVIQQRISDPYLPEKALLVIDLETGRPAFPISLHRPAHLINTGGGKKTIFHSDRGIQYSSKSFQRMLAENGLVGSMGRPGCPYDNAPVEGFFSIAKRECLYRKKYDTMDEVERDLFAYIELFYNRKRMQKGLGYLSPVDYRLAIASREAVENR